jgi:hypothetical protein
MSTSDLAAVVPDKELAASGLKLRHFVLTVLVVWIASVPCAEVIFRILGDHTTTDMVGVYQRFGQGGYKMRPNVHTDSDNVVGRYSFLTDELGLRCGGSDLNSNRERKDTDIVVLGDSQGIGFGLNFEDTTVGQLALLAQKQGLVVKNVSVVGHLLDNQFELLQWLDTQGVRPRRIVIFLTPYMTWKAGGYARTYVDDEGRLADEFYTPRRRITLWFKRHTVAYARLRNAISEFLPVTGRDITPSLVKIYRKAGVAGNQERLSQFLAKLSAWSAERDASILLVYAPGAFEWDFDPIVQAGRSFGIEVDRNAPRQAASAAAAASGVPFLDLKPELDCESRGGQSLTLKGDPHYNARVSASLARGIWGALNGNNTAEICKPSYAKSSTDHH